MARKLLQTIASVTIILSVASACSGGAQTPDQVETKSQKPPEATKEPVKLTFYYMYADSNEEQFMKEHGSLIQKKYPNFSFQFLQNTKGNSLEDIVAAKTNVDVFITINPSMMSIKDMKLDGDMTDLVEKYKFDLNRFEPAIIGGLKKVGEGKLPGLPFKVNTLGLFYNKDLFDKFGVPYPKDGMTWDDVYETAKKLTREEDGVLYRGFGIRTWGQLLQLNQLSHQLVDAGTRTPTVNTDPWKRYLTTFAPLFQMSAYEPSSAILQDAKQADLFFKEKSLAMLVQMNSDYPKAYQNFDINWDVTTFPTFQEKSGVGPQPDVVYYALSANSKHRDEAFLAMAEITSDDVQLERSKLGNPSVLKHQAIRDAFGTETPDLNGKNKKALIPETYAEPTQYTKYNPKVVAPLAGAFRALILGDKDANTALRETEEKAKQDIEAMDGALLNK